MTDPTNTPPQDASTPEVPPVPPAPAYDASPYVAPSAPAYDTAPFPSSPEQPASAAPASEAPAYAPPAYPPPAYGAPAGSPYGGPAGSPYGTPAPSPYGAPAPSPYGAQYPVQTTPGAPPVASYGYGAYPPKRTNGLAIASMILSIVGFIWILPFLGGLIGAIMGHFALGQIKNTGEDGRGMALAGIIVGWAGVALIVAFVALLVIIGAFSSGASGRYGA